MPTYEYSLVGCFLTVSDPFSSNKEYHGNLWHPLGGVQIFDLGEKIFLFKFYHRLDIIDRVINGASWTFNNHLLVFYWMKENEDPLQVPLVFTYFWVQIHDSQSVYSLKVLQNNLGTSLVNMLNVIQNN